jgi:hypothetical protein
MTVRGGKFVEDNRNVWWMTGRTVGRGGDVGGGVGVQCREDDRKRRKGGG